MIHMGTERALSSISDSAILSLSQAHSLPLMTDSTHSSSHSHCANLKPAQRQPRRRRSAFELHRSFYCQQQGCNKRYEAWRSLQHHYFSKHGLRAKKHDARWQLPNPTADYSTDPIGSPEAFRSSSHNGHMKPCTSPLSFVPIANLKEHVIKGFPSHGRVIESTSFDSFDQCANPSTSKSLRQSVSSWESFDTLSFSSSPFADPFTSVSDTHFPPARKTFSSNLVSDSFSSNLVSDSIEDVLASIAGYTRRSPAPDMTEPAGLSQMEMLQLTQLLRQLNAVL